MSEWVEFGRFLVDEGWVSRDAVAQGLQTQRRMRKLPLGEVLVELGMMTRDRMDELVRAHLAALYRGEGGPRMRIGEYLVDEGVLSAEQVEQALSYQRKQRRMPLGEILIELGHLDRATLELAIAKQMALLAEAG